MRNGEREWQVIRLRAKGEYLTTVKAKDEKTAVRVAMKLFKLTPQEGKKLMARPCR